MNNNLKQKRIQVKETRKFKMQYERDNKENQTMKSNKETKQKKVNGKKRNNFKNLKNENNKKIKCKF